MRADDWQIAVWRKFLVAHARITRQLEQDLAAEAQLPLTWYDVLLQLAEAPDRRLRMADLAERVVLSRSGLSRLVDRLERQGLVRREPSPGDARGTFTVLLAPGIDRLRKAVPSHLASVREYFISQFTEDELRTLGELLERVDPEPTA